MLDPEKQFYAITRSGRENIRNFIISNLRTCGSKKAVLLGYDAVSLGNRYVRMRDNVAADPSLGFKIIQKINF